MVLYTQPMSNFDPFEERMSEEQFDAYLQLCKEVFLDMQAAGSWPWSDSQFSEDLVESDDT